MLFGTYHFFCSFETDAWLPVYKGSTFRSAFGLALRNVVCALKRQECCECLLREKCLYPKVFETRKTVETTERPRTAAPPHPFVIDPPLNPRTQFPKGSAFDFQLIHPAGKTGPCSWAES
ncbi:MAG: hypothetical protein AB1512_20335 [Thermodesulfobacteriota bacterium]